MDVFLSGNAVLKVQTVFIGMQFIIGNADFAAFGDGDGDLVTVYRQNVEYDGIFSVEELKLVFRSIRKNDMNAEQSLVCRINLSLDMPGILQQSRIRCSC